ncbi:MAG: hypothetical protein H3C47_04140 [Candidatus Cloacimonetes bacterium]|nr:hypothetical protein [Candidatus Cloacimonadota bacterium]
MQMLEAVARKLGWSEWRLDRIRSMERVMEGSIYAEMEGEILPVTWFRMVHSSADGCACGRFVIPYLGTMETAENEARHKSLVCSLLGLPMSGAYGGLLMDSEENLNSSLIQALAQQHKNWLGVERDLWLMGTSEIADQLAAELEKFSDSMVRASILGKSMDQGGVGYRNKLHYFPMMTLLKSYFRREVRDHTGIRCLVVAPPSFWPGLCKELQKAGFLIAGVSDGFGGICSKTSLDQELLDSLSHQTPMRMGMRPGSMSGDLSVHTQAEFYWEKADLLLIMDPAYSIADATHTKADIILPIGVDISSGHLEALEEKVILPDLLASCAESIFDFVEMQQNLASEVFSESRIEKLISRKIEESMDRIYQVASETNSSHIEAAWMLAMQNLESRYPKIHLEAD